MANEPRLILGEYIKLNDIFKMKETMVVGHVASMGMAMTITKNWTTNKFSPKPGNVPHFLILAKGWMGWIMSS